MMLSRWAVLAAFAAAAAIFSPAVAQTAPAEQCHEANLRIYFAQGETALNDEAVDVLRRAEERVDACDYVELRVLMDGDAPHARARGDAILAAADGRSWDVARVEQREGALAAAPGPEFAEVVMAPRALPVGEELPATREAGA